MKENDQEWPDDRWEISGKALERYFELHEALIEFSQLFNNEKNERAAAILGATYLDTQLEHLLWSFLADEEKEVKRLLAPDQPLGTFGSKISMAYCLGFLNKAVHSDLRLVQRIRNRFAHDLRASLAEEPIRSWCLSLKWHEISMMTKPPNEATPAQVFLVGVNQLGAHLSGIVSATRGQKRKVPTWP